MIPRIRSGLNTGGIAVICSVKRQSEREPEPTQGWFVTLQIEPALVAFQTAGSRVEFGPDGTIEGGIGGRVPEADEVIFHLSQWPACRLNPVEKFDTAVLVHSNPS